MGVIGDNILGVVDGDFSGAIRGPRYPLGHLWYRGTSCVQNLKLG